MIGAFVRTILVRILLFLIICVWAVPLLILLLLPERYRFSSKIGYKLIHSFYWAVLKGSLVPIRFIGKEHIPNEPVIFAANHQSSLDIPLVGFLSKGMPHVWLARYELLDSLLLRWILPRMAVVSEVTSARKAAQSLIRIISLVNGAQRNLIIFPEGSRYTDDEVHEFFGGFVILAKKLNRAVVPVRIFNANKVYPPNTFLIRWHPITVKIGKPFVIEPNETDEAFKQRVYKWFVEVKE